MCRWMGLRFSTGLTHVLPISLLILRKKQTGLQSNNGVAFSIELLEWGRTFSTGILGIRMFR